MGVFARVTVVALSALCALVAVSGCTSDAVPGANASTSVSTSASSGAGGVAVAAPTDGAAPTADAAPTGSATGDADALSAEQAFRAWLTASRKPDVKAACDPLAPALVTRMLAELNTTTSGHFTTCGQMITATAQLFTASGQTADITVDVRSETATAATLFVTYADTGKCGTVVMTRAGGDWTITEQSQVCAA